MLEQRRAHKKGYITLREAADFAGYTPDYVGQLIRAGKIKGEQVYSGIAWVTTKKEVEAYLGNKSRTVRSKKSQPFPERYVTQMRTFIQRNMTVVFVVLFGSAILSMQYAIYLTLITDPSVGSETIQELEVAVTSEETRYE
ncbi:MAG: hypothetical protein AAFO91_01445 [Bacteroidota bacterium]